MSTKAKSTSFVVTGGNDDQPWDGFKIEDYLKRNYGVAAPEDLLIARGVILGVLDTLAGTFGTYKSLTEIGAGGTLRTSALLAPLLAPDATVVLTDVGGPQLQATQDTINQVRQGELGIWAAHEAAMAEVNPAWKDAIARIGTLAKVRSQSLYGLRPNSTDIVVEGHVLCSNTNKREEYEAGRTIFYNSVKPNGIALRLMMVGSTGYQDGPGGHHYSSYPVDLDAEVAYAEKIGLCKLAAVFAPRPNDPDHLGARDPNDPTTYEGYAALLLQKSE